MQKSRVRTPQFGNHHENTFAPIRSEPAPKTASQAHSPFYYPRDLRIPELQDPEPKASPPAQKTVPVTIRRKRFSKDDSR